MESTERFSAKLANLGIRYQLKRPSEMQETKEVRLRVQDPLLYEYGAKSEVAYVTAKDDLGVKIGDRSQEKDISHEDVCFAKG